MSTPPAADFTLRLVLPPRPAPESVPPEAVRLSTLLRALIAALQATSGAAPAQRRDALAALQEWVLGSHLPGCDCQPLCLDDPESCTCDDSDGGMDSDCQMLQFSLNEIILRAAERLGIR